MVPFLEALITGMIVWVSVFDPSKHPISNGNSVRSTRSPTTICGSTRRSFEYPTWRRDSSFPASKQRVVTS
ncbi:hypothetical protein CIK62_17650 [Brevibacterium aurantiacum]|uniref:Uncharacterized protein n=1 Tax=Brevibacterium aurantiacum TaxID=273384 RepID=A0A2A3ZAN0_BREAU|nr:hypothetical protein CIK62_17650 [Brevibacterium aurantiacum]